MNKCKRFTRYLIGCAAVWVLAALPALAAHEKLATPEQLTKALTSRVMNKALVRDYLDNGGDPNVCIPRISGNGHHIGCVNLTLALIIPSTEDLALLAIQKGGLKTPKAVQRGFWDAVDGKLPMVVEVLIKKGANVNGEDPSYSGSFPITTAADNNDFETVRLLTQAGANVNQVGLFGYTALASALERGNEEMALYLVHHGASLNAKTDDGETLLTFAVGRGSVAFVTALVSLNFDVNVVDRYGITPLSAAVSMPHMAPKTRARIIKLLLNHGADPCYRIPDNGKTSRGGKTVLDIARDAGETMSIKILQAATKNCKKTTESRKP